ncbi:MAG: S26 family signal peptidase [Sedimentisphaeraceae bacterium JB056]
MLEAPGLIDVHPPRMSRWKKPLRKTLRGLRRSGLSTSQFIPDWLEFISFDTMVALIESLIPGLAHLLQKRFQKIWKIAALWLVVLLIGIHGIGTQWGAFFLLSAIATHAYIMIDSTLLSPTLPERLGSNLLAILILYYLYIPITWSRILDLQGCIATFNMPSASINANDYLIAHRENSPIVERDDVVVVPSIYVEESLEYEIFPTESRRDMGKIVGQVIAISGDTLELKDMQFTLNGQPLDKEKYSPQSFHSKNKFKITLGESEYFVNLNYRTNNATPTGMIMNVSKLNSNEITAVVVAKWQPWRERSFLGD